MAAPLISKTTTPLVGTFDFNDIADGTGVVVNYLYVGTSVNSGAESQVYKIGRETPMSEIIELTGATGAGSTYDFYTGEFSSPRIMQGTAILSFGWWANDAARNGTIQVKLYHVRGLTNTQLGETANLTHPGSGITENLIFSGLGPQLFTIGDQFRIEIVLATGNGALIRLGVDPQNSDGTELTPSSAVEQTQFIARIPFKIRQ